MRLEFYRVDDVLKWDIQENGWSLLGEDYEDDSQVFGFFMNPNTINGSLESLPSFPLSRDQATFWLYSAGFLPLTEYTFEDAEELKLLACSNSLQFPSKISMLLSTSNGVQGQQVQEYVTHLRAKTQAMKDSGYVSNEYISPPSIVPYFEDTDSIVKL